MSKAQLKKELNAFEKEQIIELLLNLYSARPQAKEYLEFFINPDAEAAALRYLAVAQKELMRTRRGYRSKARISVIKQAIKDFATLDPGPEYVMRLYAAVIDAGIQAEYSIYFSDPLIRGYHTLVQQAVKYGFENDIVETTLQTLDFLNHTDEYKTQFARELRTTLHTTIDSLKNL